MVKSLPAMQETKVQSLGGGRSPGEGNGALLQYFCLGNPMDGGAWQATVHGVTKSQTQLSGSPTSWALILTLLPMWFVLAISHFDRGRVKRQIGD